VCDADGQRNEAETRFLAELDKMTLTTARRSVHGSVRTARIG
jgi:hypothetical protein